MAETPSDAQRRLDELRTELSSLTISQEIASNEAALAPETESAINMTTGGSSFEREDQRRKKRVLTLKDEIAKLEAELASGADSLTSSAAIGPQGFPSDAPQPDSPGFNAQSDVQASLGSGQPPSGGAGETSTDEEPNRRPRSGTGLPVSHPVALVDGRYARVADLLVLQTLPADSNSGDAFSESTQAALSRARSNPVRMTRDGKPIIGVAAFLRAALARAAKSLEPSRPPFGLDEWLVTQIYPERGPTELARLEALIPIDVAGLPVHEAIAAPELTKMLTDAARIVWEMTPRQSRIDLRHALLAALNTAQGQRVFYELDAVGQNPQLFFQTLFHEAEIALSHSVGQIKREAVDEPIGIENVIRDLKYLPEAAPAKPPRRSELRYIADGPAKTLAEDRLGVADEVRSLAEVICLKDPGPPLAIGLFGDWGSGKSTYMNMLEAAIEELALRARSDDADEFEKAMIGKAVHIKFNAWTYNDANLWASLTAELFDQLRAGGNSGLSDEQYKVLVGEVARRVAVAEEEIRKQESAGDAAAQKLQDLDREIQELQEKKADTTIEALKDAAKGVVQDVLAQGNPYKIKTEMARIGFPLDLKEKAPDKAAIEQAISERQKSITDEIDQLSAGVSLVHRTVSGMGRAISEGNWRQIGWPIVALVVVGAGAVTLLTYNFADIWARLTLILPFVTSGWLLFTKVKSGLLPVLHAANRVGALRIERARQIDQALSSKNQEKGKTQIELKQALAAKETGAKDVARFKGGGRAQVYDYFLNFSEDTRRFEKELGTISWVRRTFEQLNAILTERELPASAATLTPDEKSNIHAAAQNIDRIVLYVDDLDRCDPKQVVKVLEAVHLLLAFPLFVVVVGVDARWLQHSLLDIYNKQLRDAEGKPIDGPDRATVQDYLEKIFQIPIHLRRLSAAEGNFRLFLDAVAGPVEVPAPPTPSIVEPLQPGETPPVVGTISPINVELEPELETIEETVARITLRKVEVDTIDALAPLLGKSPRALKRFMNIYRLMRGLRRGSSLDEFLDGSNGEPALYPAVQFWLSVHLGLPASQAKHFHSAVVELLLLQQADPLLRLAEYLLNPKLPTMPPDLGTALPDAISALRLSEPPAVLKRYADALQSLGATLAGKAGSDRLLQAEAETMRFTLTGA